MSRIRTLTVFAILSILCVESENAFAQGGGKGWWERLSGPGDYMGYAFSFNAMTLGKWRMVSMPLGLVEGEEFNKAKEKLNNALKSDCGEDFENKMMKFEIFLAGPPDLATDLAWDFFKAVQTREWNVVPRLTVVRSDSDASITKVDAYCRTGLNAKSFWSGWYEFDYKNAEPLKPQVLVDFTFYDMSSTDDVLEYSPTLDEDTNVNMMVFMPAVSWRPCDCLDIGAGAGWTYFRGDAFEDFSRFTWMPLRLRLSLFSLSRNRSFRFVELELKWTSAGSFSDEDFGALPLSFAEDREWQFSWGLALNFGDYPLRRLQ